MFAHYLKIAFRNLFKYKSQSIIGTIGLTAACFFFAFILFVLSFVSSNNKGIVDYQRMFTLRSNDFGVSIVGDISQTLNQFLDIESFTASTLSTRYVRLYTDDNQPDRLLRLHLAEADTTYFNFYSLNKLLLIGNRNAILNIPNSLVLFESAAEKFGNIENIYGKSVIISDVVFTITGIMKDLSFYSNAIQADGIMFNFESGYLAGERLTWKPGDPTVVVKLHNVKAKENFKAALENFSFNFEYDNYNENTDIESVKIYAEPLNAEFNREDKLGFVVVFIVGLLILCVALFNIISFQTSQFYNRLKECAVRKLVGCSRLQLLLSFYMEIIVIFTLAYIIGMFSIYNFTEYLTQFLIPESGITPKMYVEMTKQMLKFMTFSVILGLAITFVFCIVPVQIISRQSIKSVVMGVTGKTSRQRGRKILLFVQLVVMLIAFSITVLMHLQFGMLRTKIWHTVSKSEQKNIFGFTFDKRAVPDIPFELVLDRLARSVAIEDIFYADNTFSQNTRRWGLTTTLEVNNQKDIGTTRFNVSNNFAKFFNANLISGRFWNENDSPDVIVVDQTFAELFDDNNPVGMNVEGFNIIGVVENIQMRVEGTEHNRKRPTFYTPYDISDRWLVVYIKAAKKRDAEARQHALSVREEFYPDFSQEFSEFEEEIKKATSLNDKNLLVFVSILCLILCLLTIYSAITMSTEKRRKEVAIRKIAGATLKDIIILFSRTYLILWTTVCILFFPVVYLLGTQMLKYSAQKISINFWFFSGIYLSILALIFLIIIFRILEVSRANTAEVIKSE